MELYNTLTKKKDKFRPINPKRVSIYVCGITPYDTTHLGHAFTYISFDTLTRFLKFVGYDVNYTQNITDINDRDKDILQRAKEQNITWQKLSNFWVEIFIKDMKALNWNIPNQLIKASENIPAAINMIQNLLNNKVAYQVNGSVYLEILKFPNFGKLSGFSRNKMLKFAKDFEEDVDNPAKKDPLDITLWRSSEPNQEKHIPIFQSPFGPGRPGWHIECSSMAVSTLGQQIDIHGGGKDLIFPHHESEIVQSEAATKKFPFAKTWIHTGTVYFKREKMSKSKANLVMVSELLKKYSGNSIRWLILSNHWSKDWEFKEEDLKIAEDNIKAVQRKLKHQLKDNPDDLGRFIKIMNQNLNTPKALELLIKKPNKKIYEVLGFY
jgi:cysteinyl-tRNA synthetase